MAFDGGFLKKISGELNEALDCHIDKICQPSRDELVFTLRKKGFAKKLLISVKSGRARIHFTDGKYENPATPPNFCMVLRKHLSSARLVEIDQSGLERIIKLKFSATNEMGDYVNLKLVCELIGNSANVILVGQDGKIIDALRKTFDIETAKRLILCGAAYVYPNKTEKLNPIEYGHTKILKSLEETKENISEKLLNTVEGFSPLVCREIEFSAQTAGVSQAFLKVLDDLTKVGKPTMVIKPDGTPLDYSYTDILQYGNSYKLKYFPSFSKLLDEFYFSADLAARIKTAAADITKLVKNLYSRTEKKLSLRISDLEKSKDRENLRIYGELIKANISSIENGTEKARVVNYYDENFGEIEIPLNPALSPAKNADKYFKEYKKSYTAEQTLSRLIEKDREELIYFESVLESIEKANTVSQIAEIREELENGGYIKRTSSKPKKNIKPEFKETVSVEGYKIIIGKNNTQNDYITTKLAAKNDLWFHTKNIPGSHVVVFCNGNEVSDETIIKAATLAAENSKAKLGASVPVDYTLIKNVKKPAGAKPGMVIYTTNKTVFVTPKKENSL